MLSQIKSAFFVLFLLLGAPVSSQDFSALARMDVAQSGARDGFRGATVNVYLSQPVPYRVFTLDTPRRLVMDFKEVDFRDADQSAFTRSDWIDGARFGGLRPGWSRLILDLSTAARIEEAGMQVNTVDGTAEIEIFLSSTSEEAFSETAGPPNDPDWAFELEDMSLQTVPKVEDRPLVIVIDPGHGGIDPGAEHGGVHEADVMLALALELTTALGRIEGVQPAVTRRDDRFVTLHELSLTHLSDPTIQQAISSAVVCLKKKN